MINSNDNESRENRDRREAEEHRGSFVHELTREENESERSSQTWKAFFTPAQCA